MSFSTVGTDPGSIATQRQSWGESWYWKLTIIRKAYHYGSDVFPSSLIAIVARIDVVADNVHVDSRPGDTRFHVWLPFAATPEVGNNQLDS
jgi:hypothetical protein